MQPAIASDHSQVRQFTVDKHIIFEHIFQSQRTDSVAALAELIQNSLDAAATTINVTITPEGFTVTDDGQGFQSKEAIYQWFEVFGAIKEDVDETRFSRFRLGRGQIMGLASTLWRSGAFTMDVDIKERGLEYGLQDTSGRSSQGCSIEGQWYGSISKHFYLDYYERGASEPEIAVKVGDKLRSKVKHVSSAVITINGIVANIPNDPESWDYEDDLILFRKEDSGAETTWGSGKVQIYNLGIYTDSIRELTFNGTVVTKTHMALTMCRTTIRAECHILHHIKKVIATFKPKLNPKAKFQPDKAQSVFSDYILGALPLSEIIHLKLFSDIHGKNHKSLLDLVNLDFTIAREPSSLAADRLSQVKSLYVISVRCLPRLYFCNKDKVEKQSAHALFVHMQQNELGDSPNQKHIQRVLSNFNNFDQALQTYCEEDKTIHAANELNAEQLIFLETLRHFKSHTVGRRNGYHWPDLFNRTFVLGSSATALGWTDGDTYICLHKNLCKELDKGLVGAIKIATIICHETSHSASVETLTHNVEFYEEFHSTVMNSELFCAMVTNLLVAYDTILAKHNKTASRSFRKIAGSFRRDGIAMCDKEKNSRPPILPPKSQKVALIE